MRRGRKSLLMLLISALAALVLQAGLITLYQREMATFLNIVKRKWFSKLQRDVAGCQDSLASTAAPSPSVLL